MITIPLLKMIPNPQSKDTLVETYEAHMSNFKPNDIPSRVFIPEVLWKNSPLRTGSSSLSTTRTLLPRLGHHLQVIPEPYQILLGFQMVEDQEASLATKDKKKELMHQIILPMKKCLAKTNRCLSWFMKPSMPLLTTHPLILTKFCLSAEPTQDHLRHPISSPRPRPTFLSTN